MPLEYRRKAPHSIVAEKSPDQTDPELTGWARPEARLKEALEKNEFALYCQPMLALRGDERYPMGEILVRMREEEKAMLPPGEFLPVLEHYGMMPLLDRWVVSALAKHLARGSRLSCFTMNVSAQTLRDADFPSYVAAELKRAGVPADALVFEIEEVDVLAREALVARFVSAMKAVGCGVLVDGFGRKAVSFTPLKTLGAHFVKVDGSIIRKLLSSEVARTKLNAILRVGQAINLKVIAECVEEQDVLARLKALGVDYAQGFGIVQPQPIETLTK
jgi:EAL domain-containing protein (putative c-di-GMP-specific phosphodiesterase class I)